jgi:hypothetical protein
LILCFFLPFSPFSFFKTSGPIDWIYFQNDCFFDENGAH